MGADNDYGLKDSEIFPEDGDDPIWGEHGETASDSGTSMFQEDDGAASQGNSKMWLGVGAGALLVIVLILVFIFIPEEGNGVPPVTPTPTMGIPEPTPTHGDHARLDRIKNVVKASCCWIYDPNDPSDGRPAIITSAMGLVLTYMPLDMAETATPMHMSLLERSSINDQSDFQCEKMVDIEEDPGVHFVEYVAKTGGSASFTALQTRRDDPAHSELLILNIYQDTLEVLPYGDFKRKGYTAQDRSRWWPAVNNAAELVGCFIPGDKNLKFVELENMGLGD